ncbi:MAG TPA: lipid A phosphate methyltransferase [Bacteroidales bacterium]|nr:lipid A phosphate methyltransferase [Bacteroidales bacterium]
MALIESFCQHGNFLFRHRSYLPVILIFAGIGYYVHLHISHQYSYSAFYFIVCFIVGFIGLVIRAITIGYTPRNTSGRNTKKQVADTVNTSGMYSLVRHPLYLGNFFMWLGLALLTRCVGFVIIFMLVYWLYYERIMYAEEFFLREKFGHDYLQWANSVPSFFPLRFRWHSPGVCFSFRKVVKRESIGLFNLVLMFFIFQYIHEVMTNGGKWLKLSPWGKGWFIALVAIGVIHLAIRTIRKKTKLLEVDGR